jgi:tripartite-type tricarboxylate transporter receptor subunit TctC
MPALADQSCISTWLAPAGTPKPIIERVAQATRALLSAPDYQQLMTDAGFEATPESSPEEFRAILAADVALWTPVVKALGLKID